MSETILYTQPGCGPCAGAKRALGNLQKEYGIAFDVVDVTEDPEAYEAIKAAGATGTPVLKHDGVYHVQTMDVLSAIKQMTKELNQ